MKKRRGKGLPWLLMCAVGVAALAIGLVYFDFISDRIYEDSTDHLEEIYGQVNRAFGAFVERNWGLLEGWGKYLARAGEDGEAAEVFIEGEREYSNHSSFAIVR